MKEIFSTIIYLHKIYSKNVFDVILVVCLHSNWFIFVFYGDTFERVICDSFLSLCSLVPSHIQNHFCQIMIGSFTAGEYHQFFSGLISCQKYYFVYKRMFMVRFFTIWLSRVSLYLRYLYNICLL